ncbi:hypothetical protein CAQU_09470 [Corynebacterium aquilae DSM 44791]|uniref:Uncharacterized protein n=1 Tax=Corynebacterium aquilae DSM 44791 TaxID=1431546 RepID=A0A1L7CHB8_9CORY|nr:hypothetical protein CAQU_09470 [Corynebacterium aquilae DSM 44791]
MFDGVRAGRFCDFLQTNTQLPWPMVLASTVAMMKFLAPAGVSQIMGCLEAGQIRTKLYP